MEKEKKVKVFSTPTCPYCVMVKNYLSENKIAFEDVDVSKDEDAAREMVGRSQQIGVPQLWIGDQVVVGFDLLQINQILGIK